MDASLSDDSLRRMHAYWRAANYLSVGQIYLSGNALLETPLTRDHIKSRLLGHWGTTPGLNFLYVHLNRLIHEHDLNMIFVTGPGHGGPGIVANTYLEGSYTERFPAVPQTREGMERLFLQFSWPHGVPSHTSADTPGSIHEGGELGYSLAHAFGAAFDSPDLIVACVVGDGEAETGALAASWHSNKFLNPARDGAVLPILHLNGYKIANPTILARIGRRDLTSLLRGYGYAPFFVEGDDTTNMHQALAKALDLALRDIRVIQAAARMPGRPVLHGPPRWPLIVLQTPKGWTGPKIVDGYPVEGTWRAHQVPIADFTDLDHVTQLETWLQSYGPEELFDKDGKFVDEFAGLAPTGHRRMGSNPHANGGELLIALELPDVKDHAIATVQPGGCDAEPTRVLGVYLRDLFKLNVQNANFRLFGPDETASNRLDAVYEQTGKAWMAESQPTDTDLDAQGRVMEVLSEHLCEGWLEGYLLTGRHGLFSCYEAFISIAESMIRQHAKWLQASSRIPWRKPIASLNILLTSHVWRQDHNGFSHQNPGFLDSLANFAPDVGGILLPPDANCLLAVTSECLRSRNKINVIVAGKHKAQQWLGIDDALQHCSRGAGIWSWASYDSDDPDVVMACAGDVPTLETLAAVSLLRRLMPGIRIRVVNVVDLFSLQTASEHPQGWSNREFDATYTVDRPVVFAFHGYAGLVQRLIGLRPQHPNFHVRGYKNAGTTTTPFDMVVLNNLDRYQLALDAISLVPRFKSEVPRIQDWYWTEIQKHNQYIGEQGDDLPQIRDWRWPM